ncbi:hypothetical protein [Pelomonas sp. SE-A7]|uniref:hypothetical protein n=1 Tax=Pelomonas sp. SE-A7 TaxID=3054953 RepID=UPI00259CBE81|nr:hypothetical protein [Pelomonas sp. SE-A7]MDM4767039.1 hypothetical protein [Pelomonas sp. SE-A7]
MKVAPLRLLLPSLIALSLATPLPAAPPAVTIVMRYCLAPQPLPPFVDPEHFEGISERLAREAGRRVGFALSFRVAPRARCRAELASGKVDAMAVADVAENRAVAEFPRRPDGRTDRERAVMQLHIAMVRRVGTAYQWDGEKFIGPPPPIVGIRIGAAVVSHALQGTPVQIDESARDLKLALAKLKLGRVDAVFGLKEELAAVLANESDGTFEMQSPERAGFAGYAVVGKAFYQRHRERVEAWWRQIGALRGLPEFDPASQR